MPFSPVGLRGAATKRLIKPEEVADGAVYLCRDMAGLVNGARFVVMCETALFRITFWIHLRMVDGGDKGDTAENIARKSR